MSPEGQPDGLTQPAPDRSGPPAPSALRESPERLDELLQVVRTRT